MYLNLLSNNKRNVYFSQIFTFRQNVYVNLLIWSINLVINFNAHTHTHTHSHKYIYIYIYIIYIYIFTNPSAWAGYDSRSIFKRSLTGLNSEFSFSSTSCFTKAEKPSLPYYLSIVGGRIIGFISFPRVLVLCDMQSVSSRIPTRVAVSISYDDIYIYIYIY